MKLAKRILVFVLSIAMVLPSLVLTDTQMVHAATGVSITNASGWLESAFVEWSNSDNSVSSYNVYVKKSSESDSKYVQLDDELIRCYGSTFRADAVGLAAGTYVMKVVPVTSGGEQAGAAATTAALTVLAHDRSGFAWVDGTASGAYNEDGTLKSNAVVLYVTEENKDSIKLSVTTSSKGTTTDCTGIVAILTAYKKGYDSRPLNVRFVGMVTSSGNIDADSSMGGDILISGSSDSKRVSCGITLEGIGSDAVANGWGVRIKNASNVEVRNLAFMNCDSKELDDVGLQQSNDHIWVHNCDLFYGNAGSDGDQAKGDGAMDCKKSTYVTFSYNHFWDNGKCNLLGLSEGTTEGLYITYHHNWYDHSDSRHPRVRYYSAHVYNNYYDGNAKYGSGSTLGSSVFMEANYFRNCQYPMMTSMQGTDVFAGGTTRDVTNNATFSKEAGGTIKAYNNKMVGTYTFIPYGATTYVNKGTEIAYNLSGTDSTKDFDAYVVANRNDKVPGSVTSFSGGNTYNNFDTNSSIMYSYTPDTPDDAVTKIKKYAGRGENADFQWNFTEADDTDYSVNKALKSAVTNYDTTVVSIGGANPNYSGSSVTSYKATLDKSGLSGATAVLSKTTTIAANEVITVTIVPDAGYTFASAPAVSVTGGSVTSQPASDGDNYVASIKITGNATIRVTGTATKTQDATTYTATLVKSGLSNANATISATTGITASSSVTVTVTPSSGYEFTTAPAFKATGATVGTVSKNSSGVYTATLSNITGNITVTVTGSATAVSTTKYTVTVTSDGNGSVSPASVSLLENGSIAITATPKSGYKFSKWEITSGTGASLASSTSASTTLTIAQSNVTVKASFTQKTSSGNAAYTKVGGWNEMIYAELSGITASQVTAVTYSGAMSGSLSAEDIKYLVRDREGGIRVDIPGVKAGTYSLTITAGNDYTYSGIDVNAQDRSGFAHYKYASGVGAYNDDGTLKSNAKVIYVTNENKNTVSITSKDGTTVTGIGNILNSAGQDTTGSGKTSNGGTANSNKGIMKKLAEDGTPLVIRIVGTVADSTKTDITTNAIDGLTVYNSVNNGGTVGDNGHMARIKSGKDITIEGIGDDAVIDGWGFHFMAESSAPTYGKSFEVRNIKFINTAEDAIGMEGVQVGSTLTAGVEHCWIHNNEFYSPHLSVAAESDKKEGDGSCDFKRGQYLTVSYNYFEGCHKTNLVGASDSNLQYNLTYHHNYWYLCKARSPLTRTANVHMYNNVFDGQTDYAMNTRANAYIFSEYNLFYASKNPQRVDAGAIKSYQDSFASYIGSKQGTVVDSKSTAVSSSNKYASFELSSSLSYIPDGNYQLQTSVTEARKVIKAYTGVMSSNPILPEDVTMDMISKVPSGVTPEVLALPYASSASEKISKTVKAFTVNTTFDIDVTYSSDTESGTGVLVNEAGEVFLMASGAVKNLPAGTYMIQPVNFQAGNSLTLAPPEFKEITITNLVINPSDANYDPYELTDINLNKTQATLLVNETLDLTVAYVPSNTTSDRTVTWTSSNSAVATVVDGRVTAKSIGTADIMAQVGKFTATCKVTVSAPAQLEGITINEGNTTLTTGSSKTLTVSPTNATTDKYTVSWASDNTSVATVDEVSGKVNAVGVGTATITATATTTESVVKTATITVTVEERVIPSGTMIQNYTESGKESTFYAITGNLSTSKGTRTYEDMNLTTCLKMESSTSITFTAPSKGTLNMVFGSESASKRVSVDGSTLTTNAEAVVSTTLEAGNHSIAKVDSINMYYMEFVPDGGGSTEPSKYTAELVQTGLNGATASIDKNADILAADTVTVTITPENGKEFKTAPSVEVTGATAGSVTAGSNGTYTCEVTTFTANATITVTGSAVDKTIAVTSVSITQGTSASLEVDDTLALSVTVLPEGASDKSVTWSTEDEAIAEVSTSGVVTAVAPGTVNIKATSVSNSSVSATIAITVTAKPVAVTGVSVKASTTLVVGQTETLVAEITPSNADNKKVTWATDDAHVATVSDAGLVTAVSKGTAIITVTTEDGNKTATCEVTVNEPAPDTYTATLVQTGLTGATASIDKNADILAADIVTVTITPEDGKEFKTAPSVEVTGATAGSVTAGSNGTYICEVTTFTANATITVTGSAVNKTVAVTGVSISESTKNVVLGETTSFALTATVTPANATNKNVTWSTSNDKVATVSNTGEVSVVAVGQAIITVTTQDGAYTDNCLVTVSAASVPVTGVTLDKTSAQMVVDDTLTLTATVLPANATNRNVTWSTTDANIANVSATGVVTAVGVGSATITVTTEDESKTATCDITVSAKTIAVTGVSLNKQTAEMTVDDTLTLEATVTPSGATNKKVTWSTSNNAIATVSDTGVVTAVGAGTVNITVKTVDGNYSASCAITVTAKNVPVTGVNLDSKAISLVVGGTTTLNATVLPEDSTNQKITWSTSNDAVATVENGVITAVSAGQAVIIVTTNDGGFSANCTVTVTEPSTEQTFVLNADDLTAKTFTESFVQNGIGVLASNVNTVVVDANGKTFEGVSYTQRLKLGGAGDEEKRSIVIETTGSATFTVDAISSKGTETRTMNLSKEGISGGEKVLVDIASEQVDGTATRYTFNVTEAGRYYIYSTSGGINVYGVTATGQLKAAEVSTTLEAESITLNQTSAELTVDDTLPLTATVLPVGVANTAVTWSTSDAAVATVSQDGIVTAIAKGTATITATSVDNNKVTATCTINVSAKTIAVTGVELNKTSETLTVGDTLSLIATVAPADATNQGVTWSSDKSDIAQVDENGVVTAVAAGQAVITVTTVDGSKTATCTVTVVKRTVAVTGVELNKTSETISVGDTLTLIATVKPADATNQGVTWSSSDKSVATVDDNGVVTAVSAGNVIITVTTKDGNYAANCLLTVNKAVVPVTGITLDKESAKLQVGDTLKLTATIAPSNATNQSISWGSDAPGVATVDTNGNVKAVGAGTATITVKTQDGNYSASCTVKVTKVEKDKVVLFVERFYTKLLARDGEEGGIKYWSDELKNHRKSGIFVGYLYVDGEEFRGRNLSNEDYLEALYETFMNRSSDAGGKAYWMERLEAGFTRDYVYLNFATLPEFTAICEDYGIIRGDYTEIGALDAASKAYVNQNLLVSQYVTRCYTKVLNRAAEPEGVEHWCKEILTKNQEAKAVAEFFVCSEEFKSKNTSDTEYLEVLYRTFFGREADEAGMNYWLEQLSGNKMTRDDVLYAFSSVPEFQEILKGFGF